jgi:hypothetical protein
MLQMIFIGVATAVIAVLGWMLARNFASYRLQQFENRRRVTSRFVSRADFVDGNRHMPVSLALSQSTLFYENTDMQASLDLEWVQEVEYDNELGTGGSAGAGTVLRLRCFSQVFEFVIPAAAVKQWEAMLPAHGVLGVVPAVAVAT